MEAQRSDLEDKMLEVSGSTTKSSAATATATADAATALQALRAEVTDAMEAWTHLLRCPTPSTIRY